MYMYKYTQAHMHAYMLMKKSQICHNVEEDSGFLEETTSVLHVTKASTWRRKMQTGKV